MKKEKKLAIKVRDLTPLKEIIGGRHQGHRAVFARAIANRGDGGRDVGGLGLRLPQ